jgi:tetratricopeptide (TPR) repeat protein
MNYNYLELVLETLEQQNNPSLGADLLKHYCNFNNVDLNVLNRLAELYYKAKRFEESKEILWTIYNFTKQPENLTNLLLTAIKGNFPQETIRVADIMIDNGCKVDQAKMYKGVALSFIGQDKEAKRLLEEVNVDNLELPSDKLTYNYNVGWYLLKENKFRKGFEYYIKDGKHDNLKELLYPTPHFEKFEEGKTVLLMGEQGAGDEIIGARFGKIAKEHGMNVIFCTHHGLQSLLSRTPGIDKVITPKELGSVFFDCYVPAMRSGWYFGLDETNLWSGPYIFPSSEYIEKNKLSEKGFKIGIRWQGNPHFEDDNQRRVVTFEQLAELAKVNGNVVYSLQRDYGVKDCCGTGVIDLKDKLQTWEDTAAIINQLDLVVTSCTSIAHLAGAMGVKTIIKSPKSCYLTWCSREQGKSFWYGDSLNVEMV